MEESVHHIKKQEVQTGKRTVKGNKWISSYTIRYIFSTSWWISDRTAWGIPEQAEWNKGSRIDWVCTWYWEKEMSTSAILRKA